MKSVFGKVLFLIFFIIIFSGCKKEEVVIVNDSVEEESESVSEGDDNVNLEIEEEIDTSNWLVYKNKEYGFSFKYPENWFCGGVALDPDDEKSTFCSFQNFKNEYYNKDNYNSGGVMINIVDSDVTLNTETFSTIILRTIEGKEYNLQIAYFPFKNMDNKKVFFSMLDSVEFE